MNRQRKITGYFKFAETTKWDAAKGGRAENQPPRPDPRADLDALVELLSYRYKAALPGHAAGGRSDPPGELRLARFAVVLSFYERHRDDAIVAFIADLEVRLDALLDRLLALAAAMPGRPGMVAKIIKALRDMLSTSPQDPEVEALRQVASRGDGDVLERNLEKAVARLRARQPGVPAFKGSYLDDLLGLILGPGPAGSASPSPGPGLPSAAPATSASRASPFQLTQLFGVLTLFKGEYGFELDGVVRNPDGQVEHGSWARLDVLGPDGGQLLTVHLPRAVYAKWLTGDGDAGDVEVPATADLGPALASAKDRVLSPRGRQVRGRLWLSSGEPLEARIVALFAPSALPSIMAADCFPEESEEEDDCCGTGDLRPAHLFAAPRALAVTRTDEGGYFEFGYDGAALPHKFARLNVAGVLLPLVVELDPVVPPRPGLPSPGYEFPPRVLLEVDARLAVDAAAEPSRQRWLEQEADDCACDDLRFQHSNQVLEEFQHDILVRTTDPLVTRVQLAPPPRDHDEGEGQQGKEQDVVLARPGEEDNLLPGAVHVDRFFRAKVSLDAKVEWDEDPALAQAVTIAHGRVLTVRQTWRADGYSLGDLRYSLPLAPLQKKNIAVVDWGRSQVATLDASQVNTEAMSSFVGRERDISEIAQSAMNESIRARSDSGSNSRSAGGGFSLFGLGFGGASGGSSSAWSSSSQDSARSVTANFVNRLRDQTVQAANAVRAQRVTSVQQVSETESARAVTETVANRNACHAITVQYFEVLRHFRVECELAAVRECLYVPLPIQRFDAAKVLRWRSTLETYLPPDRLRRAVSAVDRLSRDPYPGPPGRYADEVLQSLEGELEVMLDFPMPSIQDAAATTWQEVLGTFNPSSPLPRLFEEFRGLPPGARAQFYDSRIGPVLARKFVEGLRFTAVAGGNHALDAEAVLVSRYRPGARHRVSVRMKRDISTLGIVRESLSEIRVETASTLVGSHGAIVESAVFRGATPHREMVIADRQLAQVALSSPEDVTRVTTSLRMEDLRVPRQEDRVLQKELLEHLNANVEFYHKALWWTMDPDRRFALLDGFVAPNSGGRSVASVVENRLVGIIGNCIVLPVAPGIRLDYYNDAGQGEGKDEKTTPSEDWLLDLYKPQISQPAMRVSLPTRGVFAESVMGSCNSCERVDDTRNWRWWEHPLPDEPTPIDPGWLGTRARAPEQERPEMQAPAVINQIQGAPAAPEPTGLAAILSALANGNAFRDMTGLAGTQQNSREALSESFQATTRFGELAAQIEMKRIDAVTDAVKAYLGMPGGSRASPSAPAEQRERIKQDVQRNLLSPEQGSELLRKSHEAEIRGQGAAPSQTESRPHIDKAIEIAREDGRSVEVRDESSSVKMGAAATGAARRWWPFGSRASASTRRQQDRFVRIEFVTTIRSPAAKLFGLLPVPVGEKSRQVILLDTEHGTIEEFPPVLGDTPLPGDRYRLAAVRNEFSATVQMLGPSRFVVSARGQTASGVRLLPDIDYRFRLELDLERRVVRLGGRHDAFPSYTIYVDGRRVYDKHQSDSVLDLRGDADDIEVEGEAGLAR